jgi:hypothetical protein
VDRYSEGRIFGFQCRSDNPNAWKLT